MNISTETKELFQAISKAQGKFSTVVKNATNPHFKSKFAPLDTIIEMIRPILPEFGLSVMQFTDVAESGIIIETVITHESGQYISGKLSMPTVKQDPQGYGSAITYGRRYGLAAALGIVSAEDVDTQGGTVAKPEPEKITTDQAICLRDLLQQGKSYTEKTFLSEAKIGKLEDLLAGRYEGAFNHISTQIGKEAVAA